MKRLLFVLVLACGILTVMNSHHSTAIAGTAISIQYGIVDHAQTVEQKSSHAGGAIVGGLLGAAIAGPRRRSGTLTKVIGSGQKRFDKAK